MFTDSPWSPGPRKRWATSVLQALFLGVAGLFLLRMGLVPMVLGGSFVADGADVTAQMDSETRFLAAICFGVGVLALWMFRNYEYEPRWPLLVSACAMLGGALRVLSVAMVGTPPPHALYAIPIEFGVPLTVVILVLTQRDPDAPALPPRPARTGPFAPGPRAPWATWGLRVLFVGVAGLFLVRFGLAGMIWGGAYIAHGAEVTPLLDSETRFASAISFGAGWLALWMAANVEKAPIVGVALSAFALLGGCMRLVSISLYGLPDTLAIIATVLEFTVPMATIFLLAQRAR